MIRYNAAHRGAETDTVPHTDRLGIPVVAHTALRWGALMQATPDDPPGFVPPPAPAWYRFALQSPSVAVVLAAPEGREELEEDLTFLDVKGPLAAEEYERLAENGRRVRRQRGRFRARIAVGQPSSLRQGSIRPRHFRGKEADVFAELQLHPVDLGQETGNRGPVIHRVGFRLAEVGDLLLEPGDTVQGRLQLLVIRIHSFSAHSSVLPAQRREEAARPPATPAQNTGGAAGCSPHGPSLAGRPSYSSSRIGSRSSRT
jgi:hypothetical protein